MPRINRCILCVVRLPSEEVLRAIHWMDEIRLPNTRENVQGGATAGLDQRGSHAVLQGRTVCEWRGLVLSTLCGEWSAIVRLCQNRVPTGLKGSLPTQATKV